MARVLIVDDDADIRTLVSIALRDDHEVVEAANVDEARAQINGDTRPDLVLLDWMMPGEPGTALLLEMRRSQELRSVPVVMLTAKSLIRDKEQVADIGAAAYLVKPVSIEELRAVVRSLTSA
jgi:DNA-binding response OmpR family regulator